MTPYTGGVKDARLELRISPDLKKRVEAEADKRGQKITTFVERALEAELARSAVGGQSRADAFRSATTRK